MAKKFKGKYEGPDKFKGDPKKLAAYRAAKRKAAEDKAAGAASASAPAPASTTPASPLPQQTTHNTSNTGANASGKIGLQTTFDIESDALDMEESKRNAENEAANIEGAAAINKTAAYQNALKRKTSNIGRANASSAYRGLRGDTAAAMRGKVQAEHESELTSADEEKNRQDSLASSIRTTAASNYDTRKAQLELARKAHTDSQSATNPTEGSESEDSGVTANPLAPSSSPASTAAANAAAATAPAKTYKGKYKGPDRFRGDEKKIAAWKAAQRKAGKK